MRVQGAGANGVEGANVGIVVRAGVRAGWGRLSEPEGRKLSSLQTWGQMREMWWQREAGEGAHVGAGGGARVGAGGG